MNWKFWEKSDSSNDLKNNSFDNPTNPALGNPSSPSSGNPDLGMNNPPGNDPFAGMNNPDSLGGNPNSSNDPFSAQIQPSSQPDTFNQDFARNQAPENNNLEKDLMVINAKVDSIKAILETINQRIIKIERIAEGEAPQQQQKEVKQQNSQTEYRW